MNGVEVHNAILGLRRRRGLSDKDCSRRDSISWQLLESNGGTLPDSIWSSWSEFQVRKSKSSNQTVQQHCPLKNCRLIQVWEVMNTITPKNADGTNGVHVIARLKNDNRSYFVFIKQYRIPSRSWTLEFPGG